MPDLSYWSNFGLAAIILAFLGVFAWRATWAVGGFLAPHISKCLEGLATWFTKQGELADTLKTKWEEDARFQARTEGSLHHFAEAGKQLTKCPDVRAQLDLAQQELMRRA